MNLNEIIKYSGLSKRKFSKFYNIPYTTLLNWTCDYSQSNFRKCPSYVVSLLEKAVINDFNFKSKKALAEHTKALNE